MSRITPLPADVSGWSVSQKRAALAERQAHYAEIENMRSGDVGDDEVLELEGVMEDINQLMGRPRAEGPRAMVHPVPPGGRGLRSAGHQEIAGWRSGHWSRAVANDPVIRASTDSLTPSGSVTVPALTAGLVE